MQKGRKFVPRDGSEGIWFQHIGLPDTGPILRETSTTTGLMLTEPFKQHSERYPPAPPESFKEKEAVNYKKTNIFSVHDNRHSFQDHGVYFGNGRETRALGKLLSSADRRQHWTDRDFLKHYGRVVTHYDYNTQYNAKYKGEATDDPPKRRRFPKVYPEPSRELANSDTTTSWFATSGVPHATSTQLLAVSQEPFLAANKWRYSYHGLDRCYPSYNVNSRRYLSPIDNDRRTLGGGTKNATQTT